MVTFSVGASNGVQLPAEVNLQILDRSCIPSLERSRSPLQIGIVHFLVCCLLEEGKGDYFGQSQVNNCNPRKPLK